jgi:CHAD domain-containing protein
MAEQGRYFHVPDHVTVQSVVGELGKAGFRLSQAGVYRASYEYFDTQDGRLMSGDYRLRLCRYCPEQDPNNSRWHAEPLLKERGSWQLYYRGALVLSQPDASGGILRNGAVADHLAGMTETDDLLPYLQARVVGQLMVMIPPFPSPDQGSAAASVTGPNRATDRGMGQAAGVRFENWSFKSPFRENPSRDGWSNQSMIVSVDEVPDGLEAGSLISLIQECCGLSSMAFEPLIYGLQIIGAPRPGAPVPPNYRLLSKDTLYAAIGRIVGRQAYKMWANTEGVLYDLDPEFLHDLRVATRRVRFALKIFGEQVGPDLAAELRKELSWVAKSLGRVRDIDVFQEKFSSQFKILEMTEAVTQEVVEYFRGKRRKHRERMCKIIASERYGTLLQGLRNIEEGMLRKTGGIPIVKAIPDFVGAALERMHAWFERSADSLTADDLHKLRIEFKGLRYTMEFFSDLYVAPMRKATSSFVKYQDCLGLHQDAQVALQSLKDFAARMVKGGNPDPELLLAVGSLMQVQREIRTTQRNLFFLMWSRFPKQVRDLEKLLRSGNFHRKS